LSDANPSKYKHSVGVAVVIGFAGEGFDEHENEEIDDSCDGL